MLTTVVAALVVPLALLSACGDDSGSSAADPADTTSTSSSATPSDTPASTEATSEAPDWPACDSVWVAGQKIPGGYKGCLDGSDQVAADNLSCSSGQHIVRYADRFYGVAGGKIYESSGPLDKDKGYLKMVRSCRA
jgi:hypothetical protein